MTEQTCHDGAACKMQDKATCFHACAVRAQAPVVATLNACSALVGAIGRHHDAQVEALVAAAIKHEREAIANLIESDKVCHLIGRFNSSDIAEAIRSRAANQKEST